VALRRFASRHRTTSKSWNCRERRDAGAGRAGVRLDSASTLSQTSRLVRVIAGELGGRRLIAPRGLATRPTSDRVREAMFMTLEPLVGSRVVDLYAGCGALGIEALSRGAAHADFVEFSRPARVALEANVDALGLRERARVWPMKLPQAFERMGGVLKSANLILLDPPYGGDEARLILSALGGMPLEPGTRVVAEHHSRDVLPETSGTLRRTRQRRYGETMVSFYTSMAPEIGSGALEETT
jgi:16S rRNA (guanine966-N2)-methyltransferase